MMAIILKQHGIGIICGIYLFVQGLYIYADPIEYKTGFTLSGVGNTVMTYNYTEIDNTFTYILGLMFIGVSIVIMYYEALGIAKK